MSEEKIINDLTERIMFEMEDIMEVFTNDVLFANYVKETIKNSISEEIEKMVADGRLSIY